MTKIKRPEAPDLSDTIGEAINHIYNNFNSHQIGIIQSFDVEKQTATLLLAVKRLIEVDINDNKTFTEYPILVDCPCVVISGGLGSLEMPISEGDECLVLFNDRIIDDWFISGEISALSSNRTHDLSDGIALVGIRSLAKSLLNYYADAVKLRYYNSFMLLDKDNINISCPESIIMESEDCTIETDDFVDLISKIINLEASETINLTAPNIVINGNLTLLGGTGNNLTSTYNSKNETATTTITETAGGSYTITAPTINLDCTNLLKNGVPI